MKYLLNAIFFVFALQIHAQTDLPWELERFDSEQYSSAQLNLEIKPSNRDAFREYFRVYKQQRAKSSGQYALPPTVYQTDLKNYLTHSEFNMEYIGLINFLEQGNMSSLNALAEIPFEQSVTLPYRFMAAFSRKDYSQAKRYLDKMDELNMISPVLKAWGQNATAHISQSAFMTHGMQDLIGLSWALSEKGRFINAIIFNKFIHSIKNHNPGEKAFLEQNPTAWISPTYDPQFLETQLSAIRLSGIGFKLDVNDQLAMGELRNLANNFKGIGLECTTPADKGLVRSYIYFSEQVKELHTMKGQKEYKALDKQLARYLKETALNP